MASIAYWLRSAVELLLRPFDFLPEFWAVTAIAVLTSLVMVVVVGKITPQNRIRRTRARISGAVYEIRLFMDSPLRVFTAQAGLLKHSVLYVALLLPAFLVMAPLLALLYLHMDVRYGQDPVREGQQVVVRVDLDSNVDGYGVQAGELPQGLAVTAPPVFDEDADQVYLRVDVVAPGVYSLPIRAGEQEVSKKIVADRGADKVEPERKRGFSALWAFGHETPLPDSSPVSSISVTYPHAAQSWLGLPIPWWLYWLLIATIAALLLARPLHVAL